jgi:SNF2 family DNA or RNA helicase
MTSGLRNMSSAPTAKTVVTLAFDRIKQPWVHQEEALQRAANLDYFALFFETGTGKTLTAIMIARYWMFKAGGALKVLIISPPITLQNWKREWLEASKFTPDNVRIVYGPALKRCDVFKEKKVQVAITNYESLLMSVVVDGIKKWKPDIIILDESHRAKNNSSKRSKAAFELAKVCKKRIIMTGTPILNTPMDIFAQWKFLDLGEAFGKNFFEFRGNYFFDRNARMPGHIHFPKWEIKDEKLDLIKAAIAPHSMFVAKSDCLDLPPLVKTQVKVQLSAEQRKLYNSMAKDFIAFVETGVSVARLSLTKSLRLQQIVSGFLTIEDENGKSEVHEIKDNPRLVALSELLEDRAEGSKIIVWASFRHNYGQIANVCKKLGLPYVEVHGDKTQREKDASVESFNKDDSVRVLIGHPGSGGIGINLVSSNVTIFYSRTWNLEHDVQAEARNYRGGSEIHEKVTRIDLVAEDTIDELVAQKLDEKQGVSDSVVHDLVNILKRGLQ